MLTESMKLAFWISLIIGLAIFGFAAWGRVASAGAAVGILFIFLGLNGFTQLRISRLEKLIRKNDESNDGKH